jgi:putative aldouronate transport system substrate-binding protein
MSKGKAGKLLGASLLALALITAGVSATGTQEAAAPETEVYRFLNSWGMWDLSRGRIPIEEQPQSPYWQYVANKFGAAPLTVSWEWDGAKGYVAGLRRMLAAGDIPETLLPYEMKLTSELIEEGIAIPLDDLLKSYGQDVYNQLTEAEWDTVRAQAPDGKIYYVPLVQFEGRIPSSLIRKDWLDRVGMGVPQTRDELVAVYRAFKSLDANGNGDPNDEIPVSGRQGMRWCDDLFMMHGVSIYEGHPQWRWHPDTGQLISEQVSDEMRESIEFLRSLYREKLIDEVFVIQSAGDWTSKIKANKVGHYLHLPWVIETFSDFMSDSPGAEWVFMPLPQVRGKPRQKIMFQRVGFPSFVITKEAKHPEKIMEWYNWSQTEEGYLYQTLGIPGVDWIKEGGQIKVLNKTVPFYKYISTPSKYVPEAIRLTPLGEMKIQIIDEAKKNVYYGPDNLGMPSTVYEGYEDFMPENAKLYREWCSKMVVGELDMRAWDDYVKKWQASGGEVVTKRATEWYKKMKGIK